VLRFRTCNGVGFGAEFKEEAVIAVRTAITQAAREFLDKPRAKPADLEILGRPGYMLGWRFAGIERAAIIDEFDVDAVRLLPNRDGRLIGPPVFDGVEEQFLEAKADRIFRIRGEPQRVGLAEDPRFRLRGRLDGARKIARTRLRGAGGHAFLLANAVSRLL
jgi:hypothetical protein